MQVLNRYDKELVIELHREGRTIREIAAAAHLSFGDIGKIIRRIYGCADNGDDPNLSNKSKATIRQTTKKDKNGGMQW